MSISGLALVLPPPAPPTPPTSAYNVYYPGDDDDLDIVIGDTVLIPTVNGSGEVRCHLAVGGGLCTITCVGAVGFNVRFYYKGGSNLFSWFNANGNTTMSLIYDPANDTYVKAGGFPLVKDNIVRGSIQLRISTESEVYNTPGVVATSIVSFTPTIFYSSVSGDFNRIELLSVGAGEITLWAQSEPGDALPVVNYVVF